MVCPSLQHSDEELWLLQNKMMTVSNQAFEPPKNVEYSLSGPQPANSWAAFLGGLTRGMPRTWHPFPQCLPLGEEMAQPLLASEQKQATPGPGHRTPPCPKLVYQKSLYPPGYRVDKHTRHFSQSLTSSLAVQCRVRKHFRDEQCLEAGCIAATYLLTWGFCLPEYPDMGC